MPVRSPPGVDDVSPAEVGGVPSWEALSGASGASDDGRSIAYSDVLHRREPIRTAAALEGHLIAQTNARNVFGERNASPVIVGGGASGSRRSVGRRSSTASIASRASSRARW